MLSPKELVDISDKLGLIQVVKSKLLRQPDPASVKLLAALEEVKKIYQAFDQELTRYLALTLEPEEMAEDRQTLLELEGGQTAARMSAARGHCHRIGNIYQRFLNPWFQRVLEAEENNLMSRLFSDLASIDGLMLDMIDQMAGWIKEEARKTLTLVNNGDIQAAQKRIVDAHRQTIRQRRAISELMRRIYEIEADFVEAAGVV
jgi:hypothetical protein